MKTQKKRDERKLVLIEWLDAHSGHGWQPLDEIVEHSEPIFCRSVGWLISESNGMKVLVAHVSGERNKRLRLFGKGDIAIPEKSILRLAVLRTA